VERVADLLPEPIAEEIALNESMETEPPGKEGQYEQDRNENQKASGFHANEIRDCGVELVSVPGRRLSRLFGDLPSDRKQSCRMGRSSVGRGSVRTIANQPATIEEKSCRAKLRLSRFKGNPHRLC
jgi:hypothetical protein